MATGAPPLRNSKAPCSKVSPTGISPLATVWYVMLDFGRTLDWRRRSSTNFQPVSFFP